MQERVKVYTRPRCLFCHQVIDLLRQANIGFATIEVSDRKQQDELTARHQAAAFPIVLVDGHYLGGFAHILHLHSQGRLRSIASGAGTSADSSASFPPVPAPSAVSSPPRPAQPSRPSLVGTMSRLQQALNDNEPKKR